MKRKDRIKLTLLSIGFVILMWYWIDLFRFGTFLGMLRTGLVIMVPATIYYYKEIKTIFDKKNNKKIEIDLTKNKNWSVE